MMANMVIKMDSLVNAYGNTCDIIHAILISDPYSILPGAMLSHVFPAVLLSFASNTL